MRSAASTNFNGWGVDGGVKFDYAAFDAVLYGYTGKGIGHHGLYILSTSNLADTRKSDGGYILSQLQDRQAQARRWSYGISDLKLADDERAFESTSTLLKRNESGVIGAYYALTKSVNLVGEFIYSKAEAWNGNSAKEHDFALGGIFFF